MGKLKQQCLMQIRLKTSKHKKATAPMLKRKRQLQTMHKLTWKRKNLQLKVSKLL